MITTISIVPIIRRRIHLTRPSPSQKKTEVPGEVEIFLVPSVAPQGPPPPGI